MRAVCENLPVERGLEIVFSCLNRKNFALIDPILTSLNSIALKRTFCLMLMNVFVI